MSRKRVTANAHKYNVLVKGDPYPLTPQFVADWLNNGGLAHRRSKSDWLSGEKTDAYYRITNLIRAFHEAAHDLSDPARALLYLERGKPTSEPLPAPLSRINSILQRYRLLPWCLRIDADLKRWHVHWYPTRAASTRAASAPAASRSDRAVVSGWIYAGEMEVLQQVLTMATEGTLDYLAVCQCRHWYVRRRLDQKFCKAECRTEFRRSKPWKNKRARYMRRYRRLKQSGKVK